MFPRHIKAQPSLIVPLSKSFVNLFLLFVLAFCHIILSLNWLLFNCKLNLFFLKMEINWDSRWCYLPPKWIYVFFWQVASLSEVKSLSPDRLFGTQWTITYQAPLSMGFSRQEYWSGLPFPSPGDLLPDPAIETGSPTLQADALQSEPPGKLV